MTALVDFNAACVQAWQSTGLTPTAYEGVDFTPPATKWYAITLLPVSAQTAALGINAPIEHVCLLQADVNYPLNTGTGPLLADADTIAATFTPGATFTYNGIRLVCESCQRSTIRRDDAYLTVSMTVKLRAWEHRA